MKFCFTMGGIAIKKFSESTNHVIDVVKEIRSGLQLDFVLGRELDEAGWKEIVRGAVKNVVLMAIKFL